MEQLSHLERPGGQCRARAAPRGLAVLGDKLFLSDSNVAFGYARVLRYSLSNLP